MRSNKIYTIVISILIVAIIAVIAFIAMQAFNQTKPVESNNVINEPNEQNILFNTENIINNNEILNDVQNELVNDITNEVQTGNEITNEISNDIVENEIIDPILNNITPGGGTGTQTGQSIVAYYYYNQLNSNAKIIYNGLKDNKANLVSGNYTINYGTKFNTLLNTNDGDKKLEEAFQSAWNAFSYDNVDIFYIDVNKMTLINEYTSIAGIKNYNVSIGPRRQCQLLQRRVHKSDRCRRSRKIY